MLCLSVAFIMFSVSASYSILFKQFSVLYVDLFQQLCVPCCELSLAGFVRFLFRTSR